MKKILFYTVSPVLLAIPLFSFSHFEEAFGQDKMETKQDIQQKREALKNEVQEKREVLKTEINKKKDLFRQETKEKRDAMMEEFKKKREAFKDEAKKRQEELKKKLGEKRAERIEAFFNKMVEKFENAFDRLNKLADRIENMLDKAAKNGKDVSALRKQLTEAKAKITEAEKSLVEAKAKYAEAIKDKDFKVSFKKVKEAVKVVEGKVKDAHSALVDVVNSIKGLGGGEAKEEEQKTEKMVEITAGGFAPAELKVKVGTTVKFVNRDSELHWPASGVHPTHQICPGFDALKGLAKDESYSFTFKEAKTCPYHDHLNPSTKGTVVVE